MGPERERLVVVGVDIGQKVDPTAIVVDEREWRETTAAHWANPRATGLFDGGDLVHIPAQGETVHVARHIARLPLGTPYPRVAEHLVGVVAALVARGVARPRLLVDATGVGTPVVDILREALGRERARDLLAVTFTHGDRFTIDRAARTASLGKAYLVSRLQALLQTARLKLPQTDEARALARELHDYEIRIDTDANDRYGAFRVGTHDDLVTALGLACVFEPPAPRTVTVTPDFAALVRRGGRF